MVFSHTDLVSTKEDRFFEQLSGEALGIREILWPLDVLNPRERAIFTEYHYWNTHMKHIAKSHKISLGRAYEILYKSEDKVASSRASKKKKGAGTH